MTQLHWSAAARLLNRETPEGYLDERTAIVAAEKRAVQAGTKSIVIFRLGSEWLALPTNVLQEVIELDRAHKIPHRTGGILKGLVNVRGELLLCVALGVMLGLERIPERNRPGDQAAIERLLVCNRDGNRLAFFVSEVHGVHLYHPRDLKDVPATLAGTASTYTVGLLHWKERTVGCLDDGLLFYAFGKGLA
jgi:chemotaxis-related protein WspD